MEFAGKKIITTHRQAKSIGLLTDYWTIKGTFLRMKQDPKFEITPENIENILHYLEEYTELPKQRFWKRLTYQQKLRASRFFIIKECTSLDTDTTIAFQSLTNRPDIYVALYGDITIVRLINFLTILTINKKKHISYFYVTELSLE